MKGLAALILAGPVQKTLMKFIGVTNDAIENIIFLLRKKRKTRSQLDLQRLTTFFKEVPFFQQFGDKANFIRSSCSKFLRLKQARAGEVIYDFKDKLKHLYIVVEGSVQVFTTKTPGFEVVQYPGSFGGNALTKRGVLSECVICLEDATFGCLTRANFAEVMSNAAKIEIDRQATFLSELHMFKDKTKSYLIRLCSALDELKFSRGMQVFRQGTPADTLYFVKEGEFMLTHSLSGVVQPSTANVAILCRGETIGDREVLEDTPYSHNCVCVSSLGLLLGMKKAHFMKYFIDQEIMDVMQKRTDLTQDARSRRIKNYTALINTGKLPKEEQAKSPTREVSRLGMSRSARQHPSIVPDLVRQTIESYRPSPVKAPMSLERKSRRHQTLSSVSKLSLSLCPSLVVLESKGRPSKTSRDPIKRVVNMHTQQLKTRSCSRLRKKFRSASPDSLQRSLTRPATSGLKDSFLIMSCEKSSGTCLLR
jgi:CRP-like cAMP-binding protein